jgi:hypothetical protein
VLAYAHAVTRATGLLRVAPSSSEDVQLLLHECVCDYPCLPLSCRDSRAVLCCVWRIQPRGTACIVPFIVLVRERRPVLVGRPYARLMAVVIAPSIILMSVRVA